MSNRLEIDGLRAIAVGAVILYHAQITIFGHQPFKGGFIGVDIFFVISGYLVTSVILKELLTSGSFSFKHYYERRIRRILPMLLSVCVLTLPLAWAYLLPDKLIYHSKSIITSIVFNSNFYAHYSGNTLGEPSYFSNPFIHTWSLSVLVQFYILFPIVLLVTSKYFRKYLIHILILGFVISLGLADWGSRNYPAFNFYVLPTRTWELLAGSILAYFEITNGKRSENKTLNLILPSIGLILIGYSILFFNDKMFYPSFYTLSPIVGVCLIIWFSDKDELITKILSTKLFVGIGLISYSLYLWHFPIFAFATIYEIEDGIVNEVIIGLVILILSITSFYFIEKPFRNKKYNLKEIFIPIITLVFILISFNFYIIKNDGIKTRFPKIFQTKLKEDNVNFFQRDNTRKVILIGDSHSMTLEFNLNEEIKKKNLSLFKFDTGMYLVGFNYVNRRNNKVQANFAENNNKIDNFLEQNKNSIVVLHHRWTWRFLETNFYNKEEYRERDNFETEYYLEPINIKTSSVKERQGYIREALLTQINKIINQGHKLILVYPVPEMGSNPLKLLFKNYLIEKKLFESSIPIYTENYEVFKKRNRFVFDILDSIENPNIYRVYPHKILCDNQIKNKCVANDEENLFYSDGDHLSIPGSKFVVNEIIKQIEKIKF